MMSSIPKFQKTHSSGRAIARTVLYLLDMTCTVLLYCLICAEIRTVDSQSDLRILLYDYEDYSIL